MEGRADRTPDLSGGCRCVLVKKGAWGGESPSPSLRNWGACLGSQNVQEAGDGPEFVYLPNTRGPYAGLVAPGTQDKVSAPGFTEEPCSQCAEQAAL